MSAANKIPNWNHNEERNKKLIDAFFNAVENGNLSKVEILLDRMQTMDISVDYINNDDAPALILAAYKGHLEIVRLLLNKGANVNAAQMFDGGTSLMIACWNGHLEIVDELLKNGAKVNAASTNGTTSLMYASQAGHAEIVRLLCKNGANIDMTNNTGQTAIQLTDKHYIKVILSERCPAVKPKSLTEGGYRRRSTTKRNRRNKQTKCRARK